MAFINQPSLLAGACPILLRQARDLAGQNYSLKLGRKLGALDFITSPENGSLKAVDYIQQQSGSKLVTAKVLYKQRSTPCDINSGPNAKQASLCDPAQTQVEKSVLMTVNDAVATKPRTFSNSDLVQICQGSTEFIQEYLMSDQRALREKLDEKILAKMAVAAGINNQQNGTTVAAGTYVQKPLLGANASNKIPLSANWNDVLMDYVNNQFNGEPAFIGQGNLQTFYNLSQFSCCNGATPYADSVTRSGSAFFLDQAANKVLGTNGPNATRALMVAFGASQLLWFNENNNINVNTELGSHLVLPDPVYPQLKWDVDFKWDLCLKAYTYIQKAYFDVFNVFQADSFNNADGSPGCSDELYGETGIWKYEFQNISGL